MPAGERLTILHLAPHPDDEVIGAGATLLALRDAGHRIVNLACTLGRREQRERRRGELTEACERARFELLVHEPPLGPELGLSGRDDLRAAQRILTESARNLIRELGASVVVSPTPHDGHHGHELVGRAARDAIAENADHPRWWMWGLWDDLPLPTLVTLFDEARLREVLDVLSAHREEVARNDYLALIPARATVNRVLGAETAFGFGAPGFDAPYADLLMEGWRSERGWHAGTARIMEPSDPLAGTPSDHALDWWLGAPSFRDRIRAEFGGL